MSDFNPKMLRLARLCMREMTQGKLASEIGVSQGKVSKWEEGILTPSDSELETIGATLSFPIDFFFHPGEEYGFGACLLFHRKRQRLSGKLLNTIHARMNVVGMGIERLLSFPKISLRHTLELPQYSVSRSNSPDQIARQVRSDWRLKPGPISNLMSVVEATGAIIVPMDFMTDKIDAISVRPTNTPPLIFTSIRAPADRQRYTLAHELGHLVMHDSISTSIEQEADRFAAELLMPSRDIRAELSGMSVKKAASLKPKWRTAMSALIKRAKDTKAISDYRARMLFIEMNAHRRHEPVSIDPDMPGTLDKLIAAHQKKLNHSKQKLAELTFCREMPQFDIRFRRAHQPRLRIVG